MADGLTRLLAPILSFTADEALALPAGATTSNRCTWRSFREQDVARTARWTRRCVERWATAGLASRAGARPDRAAAEGQADRQLAPGTRRALGERKGPVVPRGATPRSCRCCSSCPRSSFGRRRLTSTRTPRPARTSRIERAGGVKCERCWRYVPDVSSEPEWAGLCDRCQDALGGADPWLSRSRMLRGVAAARRLDADRRGRSRSGHEVAGAHAGAAARERRRHSRLPGHHARPQYRRRVRISGRGRLSGQDDRHRASSRSARSSASRSMPAR